ncbi:MAG TPA: (2Fe-2S) ferredoxin domain-containing protein, partial [Candidatus Hydrogenedentes bacterium]|nr:(2Fe-2S) ferredoxin domain-containing protein [Candidatus Hydrogenedentota bacterium]
MQSNDLPFEKIIFVCTNKRDKGERVSCGREGGCDLRNKMKEMVKARGLKDKVRVSTSGCMDVCEEGPNVMIFPDNVWLARVKEKEAVAIVEAIAESID